MPAVNWWSTEMQVVTGQLWVWYSSIRPWHLLLLLLLLLLWSPSSSSPIVSCPGWGSLWLQPGCPTGLALSVASDGFDSWTDALWSVVPLHTPDRHLICRRWCGPCNCSRANSDQNATGREWYGLTEALTQKPHNINSTLVWLTVLLMVKGCYDGLSWVN